MPVYTLTQQRHAVIEQVYRVTSARPLSEAEIIAVVDDEAARDGDSTLAEEDVIEVADVIGDPIIRLQELE